MKVRLYNDNLFDKETREYFKYNEPGIGLAADFLFKYIKNSKNIDFYLK